MRTLVSVLFGCGALLAQGPDDRAPALQHVLKPLVGMPAIELPAGQPAPSEAQFALGQRLFADPVLSLDRTVSCRSCHLPEQGFAHPDQRPPGIAGRRAALHAPALYNRVYARSLRWDGSVATLEQFVLQPIADPDEMGFTVDGAVQRLREQADYARDFAAAYADGVTSDNLAHVLATFVRGIVRGEAAYDRFVAGDPTQLTPEQRAGFWVFESKGRCWQCHTPPLFTDEKLHNTGVGARDGVAAAGRAAKTGDERDRGRFKTPTLRGVRFSAPFMHDGSMATLEDVVDFYARGGNANPQLDERMKPIELSDQDKRNLIAFLNSL